ncbi:MAG: hypothetical protein K6F79_02640 [Saccharofermentans sp.]|nr:hypothetical protein [Saccharofermentans sp.]
MNKFKYACIGFIFISTVMSLISLFSQVDPYRESYEKYEAGEYYFLAHAKTTEPTDPNLIYNTNLDMTDSRNMLLLQTNADVYAYNLQGSYCTVVHDGNTYRDFPVNRLNYVSPEDYSVLQGKTYTYEEYCDRLEQVRDGIESEEILSDPKMLGASERTDVFAYVQLILNVIAVVGYFFERNALDDFAKDMLIGFCALVNLLLDIIIFGTTVLSR